MYDYQPPPPGTILTVEERQRLSAALISQAKEQANLIKRRLDMHRQLNAR